MTFPQSLGSLLGPPWPFGTVGGVLGVCFPVFGVFWQSDAAGSCLQTLSGPSWVLWERLVGWLGGTRGHLGGIVGRLGVALRAKPAILAAHLSTLTRQTTSNANPMLIQPTLHPGKPRQLLCAMDW